MILCSRQFWEGGVRPVDIHGVTSFEAERDRGGMTGLVRRGVGGVRDPSSLGGH